MTATKNAAQALRELVLYFLRLGLLGFGGPVALVGQMEKELVAELAALRDSVRKLLACSPSRVYVGHGGPLDPGDIPKRFAAEARPRAAAMNSVRGCPVRLSASASSPAVTLRAVRLTPRSRSLTDRGLTSAAAASSSWVSLALTRSWRNNPANSSAGCSAIAQHPSPRPT